MVENDLSQIIIGSAIKVHTVLGPGLLESAYEECLYYELVKEGLKVEKQKAFPLIYEEIKLEVGYRLDLIVEDKVIIEIIASRTLGKFDRNITGYIDGYLIDNNNIPHAIIVIPENKLIFLPIDWLKVLN